MHEGQTALSGYGTTAPTIYSTSGGGNGGFAGVSTDIPLDGGDGGDGAGVCYVVWEG